MSEAEFDLLLEAVQTAIAPISEDSLLPHTIRPISMPRAANDNRTSWPLIPFPDGWHASC